MSAARLPPTVRGLSLVSLANDLASEMVYPLLPAFVTLTLGGGATALGALDGAADVASAALKWVSGRLSDRPGTRKPLIVVGYLMAVVIRPAIALAGAAWQVIAFRVLDRVGKGLRSPARDALLNDVTPPELRGRAFGFHRAADHLGAVLGSIVAWWLLDQGRDAGDVIALSWIPGVLVLVFVAVALRRAPDGLPREAPVEPPGSSTTPSARAPIVVLALFALARLPEALLLLRLQDVGVTIAAIPLVWGALHVVRSAATYPGGALADSYGPRRLVAAGALLFAGTSALLALPLGPAAAIAVFLAFGLVAGCTEPAERALVGRLSPRRTGARFGEYHALTGFAALPAGIVFGALYEQLGASVALGTSAAVLGLVLIPWLRLRLDPPASA